MKQQRNSMEQRNLDSMEEKPWLEEEFNRLLKGIICPIDESPPSFTETHYKDNKIDKELFYCYACDVAFLNIYILGKKCYELRWYRENGQLTLRKSDEQYIKLFKSYDWQILESNMNNSVYKCLEDRRTGVMYCSNDGSKIHKVKQIVIRDKEHKFAWCVFCGRGRLCYFDLKYEWFTVAYFDFDIEKQAFKFTKRSELGNKLYYDYSLLDNITYLNIALK